VDPSVDVEIMAQFLIDERIFVKTPGRTSYSNDNGVTVTESSDLFGLGTTRIESSDCIQVYKHRMMHGCDEDGVEEENEEEVRDPEVDEPQE
jgi:hypothetical protein